MGRLKLAALLALTAVLAATAAAESTSLETTTEETTGNTTAATTSAATTTAGTTETTATAEGTSDGTTTVDPDTGGLETGAIVGICVGAAVLLLVVLLVVFRKKVSSCCCAAAPSHDPYYVEDTNRQRDPYPGQSEISAQFQELESTPGSSQPMTVGRRAENQNKNRYQDIVPYDYNRVKLRNGNYINASIIEDMFIATQDPLLTDDKDFWPMVVQQNVNIIVRLSTDPENVAMDNDENQTRCAVYLPDRKWEFEDSVSVEAAGQELKDPYTATIVRTKWHNNESMVHHYHIHGWEKDRFPPARVTLDTLPTIKKKWNELGNKGKVLVHCGAGTGRTGTFIALWILHDQLVKGQKPSVMDVCKKLRKQRPGMVTKKNMFSYLHECVKEYEISGGYDRV